jgi:formylglycine-generating enzyme required for sulfatase activity
MKRFALTFLTGALLLGACAPASATSPTTPPATVSSSPTSAPAPSVPPTLIPVALSGPQSGTRMTWLDGSQLAYISSGDFIMGIGAGDAPQKTVTLDAYWIYTTDVTNKMYAQCVATGNCAAPAQEIGTPDYTNPDYGDYPVVGVTWDMAANYCRWTQGQLPTEAQWEKAARGENGGVYPWGNDNAGCDLLNYQGCLGHTSGVNDYPAGRSPYGLLDMAGNVFQWVNDFYDSHYYDNMPAQNPTGPSAGDSHVIRGSSFESEISQTLSGLRHYGASAYHSRDLSFRCVVNQPKTIAPYCQTNSYIPTGAVSTNATCQVPEASVLGNYCASKSGYTTVQIPQGATFEVPTKDYSCLDSTVNGKRVLTCTGPNNSSGEVSVCNASCSSAPSQTGATVVCDPGYTLDAATGTCTYMPVSSQPGVSGCPQGYNLIDRGGQKVCAIGQNLNGECPAGTYFDSQYGACVAGSGSADAPYGLNNPTLASQTYQGCAAGYSYDANYQCCQANTGGTYPGCPLGFTFDATQKSCVPGQVRLSGPGCVTVSLNIAKCSQPVDVCSKILTEQVCLRNSYACQWTESNGVGSCVLKKQP